MLSCLEAILGINFEITAQLDRDLKISTKLGIE